MEDLWLCPKIITMQMISLGLPLASEAARYELLQQEKGLWRSESFRWMLYAGPHQCDVFCFNRAEDKCVKAKIQCLQCITTQFVVIHALLWKHRNILLQYCGTMHINEDPQLIMDTGKGDERAVLYN